VLRDGGEPPSRPAGLLGALAALPSTFADPARGVWLARGDSLEVLERLAAACPEGLFDAIFADPPYFLSNDGITCQSGVRVKVNKGEWDRSRGIEENHRFNRRWLSLCQRLLTPNGTIWVSGTHHVILSVGFAMQELGLKILNDIVWEKPNPPPNLSCRYFTHSTETLLWAAKSPKSKHVFNYDEMRAEAGGRQMKTVWRMTAPPKAEKAMGKHPTQKPVALVARCLQASTAPGALVLDPFVGSGTTALAALKLGRRCIGIDNDPKYLDIARSRLERAVGSQPGADVTALANAARLGKRGTASAG
jgi:site-specific DNA-methyltransferase (adenine-specific)